MAPGTVQDMETRMAEIAGAAQDEEAVQAQKTAPMAGAAGIDPGARMAIRDQVTEMPSADYQIPHISMPEEAMVGEDGHRISESKMPSAIRWYMAKLFRGKVLNIGKDHKVYIDKGGIREYAFPAKRIMGELKAAKMTAGANLDTTLEPAQFLKNGVDDGHHPEATGGWDYFYVMFETDTGIYSGIVNTKVTERGRVFHDITEIQKESGPSTHGVNRETLPPAKTDPLPSDSIIPSPGDGVNTEYAQPSGEVSVLALGKAQDVARQVAEIAGEAKGGEAAQAQKTAPMEGADIGLIPVSETMKESLSTGKNNVIAQTAGDIVAFVKRALGKKGGPERLYMGTMPEATAQFIKNQTGVDVSGSILLQRQLDHGFEHEYVSHIIR